MRTLFRWAFRFFILMLVLVVAFLLSLDSIVRGVVERRIRAVTGMDVKIGSLSLGLLSPVVTIENFKLYNKPEFGGSPCVDMPELHVVYDRRALYEHRLHFKLVRLSIAELNLVQDKQGRMNLALPVSAQPPPGKPVATPVPGTSLMFTGIETLNLSCGRLTGLKMTDPRKVKELNVKLHNAIILNIQNEPDLEMQLGLLFLQNDGMEFMKFFNGNAK